VNHKRIKLTFFFFTSLSISLLVIHASVTVIPAKAGIYV